jgi:hypothetical protein
MCNCYHDVQCLDTGKASEEDGEHFGLLADSKSHFHGQDFYTWNHVSWAHPCSSLQHN